MTPIAAAATAGHTLFPFTVYVLSHICAYVTSVCVCVCHYVAICRAAIKPGPLLFGREERAENSTERETLEEEEGGSTGGTVGEGKAGEGAGFMLF